MNHHMVLFICSTVIGLFNVTSTAQEFDIDKEILRLRKELTTVTNQRKTVSEEVAQDKKEHTEYDNRTKKRFATIKVELDSTQNEIKTQHLISDSLASVITSLQGTERQLNLQQENFRNRIISGCDLYLDVLRSFPPLMLKPLKVSLSFLRSELISKNVDNTEGIQRLTQIIRDMEEATGSIQIVQGASPISEIRGSVYQIRIGVLFEAVVNTEGTAYALWKGNDTDGKEIWKNGSDPSTGEKLLQCVNIREGKTLPAFVEIPYSDDENKGVSQ